jgi:hypothetical protein
MIIPEFISLHDWAASLFIDFPDDNIPFLLHERDWKLWGDLLSQEETFIENNAPTTETFDEWRDWAHAVYYTLVNEA